MEQIIKKPEFCFEVHTAEQHAIFRNLLTRYDRSCCFRGRYEENPDSMRAFYMTDADGTPFAAAALYDTIHGSERLTFLVLTMQKRLML